MILSYMMIISVFDVLLFFLKTLKKRQQNQIFYGEISKDKVYGIKRFLLGFFLFTTYFANRLFDQYF